MSFTLLLVNYSIDGAKKYSALSCIYFKIIVNTILCVCFFTYNNRLKIIHGRSGLPPPLQLPSLEPLRQLSCVLKYFLQSCIPILCYFQHKEFLKRYNFNRRFKIVRPFALLVKVTYFFFLFFFGSVFRLYFHCCILEIKHSSKQFYI